MGNLRASPGVTPCGEVLESGPPRNCWGIALVCHLPTTDNLYCSSAVLGCLRVENFVDKCYLYRWDTCVYSFVLLIVS